MDIVLMDVLHLNCQNSWLHSQRFSLYGGTKFACSKDISNLGLSSLLSVMPENNECCVIMISMKPYLIGLNA